MQSLHAETLTFTQGLHRQVGIVALGCDSWESVYITDFVLPTAEKEQCRKLQDH